jgi:hypothetical protein
MNLGLSNRQPAKNLSKQGCSWSFHMTISLINFWSSTLEHQRERLRMEQHTSIFSPCSEMTKIVVRLRGWGAS